MFGEPLRSFIQKVLVCQELQQKRNIDMSIKMFLFGIIIEKCIRKFCQFSLLLLLLCTVQKIILPLKQICKSKLTSLAFFLTRDLTGNSSCTNSLHSSSSSCSVMLPPSFLKIKEFEVCEKNNSLWMEKQQMQNFYGKLC